MGKKCGILFLVEKLRPKPLFILVGLGLGEFGPWMPAQWALLNQWRRHQAEAKAKAEAKAAAAAKDDKENKDKKDADNLP